MKTVNFLFYFEHSLLLFVQLNTVASVADLNEWVENADRWVSGFLEKFEEGCHVMVYNFLYLPMI